MSAPERPAADAAPAPTPARADRAAYAAQQAQLLDALLRGDGYPEGFVAAQADAAGTGLRRKRARAVAQAWPALALSLGEEFGARFDAFARDPAAPPAGDPLADGVAFARVVGRASLTDDARAEQLLGRAAMHRRGLWLRAVWLRTPYRRLLVVARLPLAGRVHRSVPARPRGR